MLLRRLLLAVVALTTLAFALYSCGDEFTGDDDNDTGGAGAGGGDGDAGGGTQPDAGGCLGCGTYVDRCFQGSCPTIGRLCDESELILGGLLSCVCHPGVCGEACGGFCGTGVDQMSCLQCLGMATLDAAGACREQWVACDADR